MAAVLLESGAAAFVCAILIAWIIDSFVKAKLSISYFNLLVLMFSINFK
jgi:hypothetical protein